MLIPCQVSPAVLSRGTADTGEDPLKVDGPTAYRQVSLWAGTAGNGVGAQSILDGLRIGTGTADAAGSPPCCT